MSLSSRRNLVELGAVVRNNKKSRLVKSKNRTYDVNAEDYTELINKYKDDNYEKLVKDMFWIKKDGNIVIVCGNN